MQQLGKGIYIIQVHYFGRHSFKAGSLLDRTMQVEDMQGPDAAIGTQHKEEHCIQVGFGPAAW